MVMSSESSADTADRLADIMMQVAGDQNVRAMEAVAAALVARRRQGGPLGDHPAELDGLAEDSPPWRGETFDLCRRIARRALRGCLDHLVDGATAFHRIDANPEWARPLLPVAVFGSFLFYRTQAPAEETSPPPIGAHHDPEASPRRQVERVLDGHGRGRDHGRQ
jgi:hypothetical protein